MTDRPILFSAPMVRALLDGRKTQTRRIAKVKRGVTIADISEWVGEEGSMARRGVFQRHQIAEPRFAVGDRLYVREAWRAEVDFDAVSPCNMFEDTPIAYEASPTVAHMAMGRFRQGMHMPRWASRLTLTVTDVRVQRLQDISEADAIAEGVTDSWPEIECNSSRPFRDGYRWLWDSLNADRGFAWDTNPWVVAVSFTVERRNIDEAG